MSSTCFSAASILRCDLLSTNESIGLVIPVILQAILTSALTVLLWARSRRQLFLACEGWIDLLLSLLNLFWELYPAVRHNLHVFRLLDIVIGSMSFMPILFYSLFLCSLILTDFITVLPPSVRRVVRPFLIFFVPVLIGMHEAASFIGISYTFSTTNQSMITFRINRDKDLWTFFTSSTLALFASFQAIAACLAIVRVAQFLIQRRRLEHRYGDHPRKIHGLSWVNAGILFGVVETIIGFAAIACFGTHLTRRITRLFSRALLCIGLFIGRHDREDSSTETPEVIPYRQSHPKPFISNPRLSTFQRLSPTATVFHQTPLAPPMVIATSEPDFAPKDEFNGAPGQQRVKILFDQGAPQLEVRLSEFELPYPSQPAMTTSAESPTRSDSPLPDYVPRPFARPHGSHTDSMASSLSKVEIVTAPRTLFVPELAKATVMRTPSGRTVNRPISSRPASPPTSQRVSSSRELLSFESRETKGKRVMSGEQNDEFFDMLMSAGVRSFADHQAAEVGEDMNISIVPSGDSIHSLALSFSGDDTTQEDLRPSSMEEYYCSEQVRFSQEQLNIQQETPQSSSFPVSLTGRHQSPVQWTRGRMSKNSNGAPAPPSRPLRNPSRTRQGSPDSSSSLAPNAVTGEFASQWEESLSSQKETEKRQPSVHFKTPTPALHTSKLSLTSLTSEPISPTQTDSDSAYSRQTYERQSWVSQMSIDPDQVAIAL